MDKAGKGNRAVNFFLRSLLMNIIFCTVINSFLISVEHDKNIYNEESSVVKKTLFSFLCINSQNTQNYTDVQITAKIHLV